MEKRLYFYTFNDALVEVVIGADRQKVNKPCINFSSLLSLLLYNLPFISWSIKDI